MIKFINVAIALGILFLSGCNTETTENTDVDRYDVEQTTDETIEDEFIFRLVSEKEEYSEGEEVKLYGEIEYVGEEGAVEILHSSSEIIFNLEEKVREYNIGFAVNDVGNITTLQQGVPYREEYAKSGGFAVDRDPQDYIRFMQDFLSREDFPTGYYIVNGVADFYLEDSTGVQEKKHYQIEAQVDFKVYE
ncbi:hypothetical protein QA612_14155 [Evansella sp. AB-P1]|uniref:hypothetical protein n=1 Tax=Evansella sp. AB-P1 TaxID=3037653 RepID=UPI002420259D|nr:hypothetical protein [Evansella sp. AB-P1]MDG5788622.1 hypothetical protein [Evansella sp. AB-P1]